ncbi:N-acetylglutaminylglutamine synthetase [Brevibacterium daeguense]|uniref:N-acetylglutaminylglutamine synthetase n=1 Tax=Brevibacterium daeguense TaxID=909936 RepID=A0ABP8ELG4_9MICO|nr:N-acetylglutaminylglutamine synthetase [Brevibacterium daeguense]
MKQDVIQELGWGRLVFGQTFAEIEEIGRVLRDEAGGTRDICMYLKDPHVLVALHPEEYFIDPSHTYRLDLSELPELPEAPGIEVRPIESKDEAEAINRIYVLRSMVPADVEVMWENHLDNPAVQYLVAVDTADGEIIGTVTGVDHGALFDDPERGSSLWCLAVDPVTPRSGLGGHLAASLAHRMADAGAKFMDLSVMWDNEGAIKLYERMGFRRTPIYGIKRKNAINEKLYAAPPVEGLEELNPYARIIADEAIRRGIRVTVLDADTGYMQLEHGGRSVITRESLSQYTTAVAMSRCEDKRVTRKIVEAAGVRVPQGRNATFDQEDVDFLDEVGTLVVKPVRGEQGAGITIGVKTEKQLREALVRAGGQGSEILLEEYCEGKDLRILVINGRVSAAAIRRPASVVGDGETPLAELIRRQSKRRGAATGGESKIPLDETTEATIREQGYTFEDVLAAGKRLEVRRTANLHTGGTIHDVTERLHPVLAQAALTAAGAIDIPVTGIDLLVPDVEGEEYVFIEANERPGLANHEPQPVPAEFIDYLFPNSKRTPWTWEPEKPQDPSN